MSDDRPIHPVTGEPEHYQPDPPDPPAVEINDPPPGVEHRGARGSAETVDVGGEKVDRSETGPDPDADRKARRAG